MDEIWDKIQRDIAAFEEAVKGVGLYHRGYVFHPPYACSRCGEPISARQFAFGRDCGACDAGHTRERLTIFDRRWFLDGRAELTNPADPWLIHPDFIPASTREQYPALTPKPPRPPSPPKPVLKQRSSQKRWR